LSEPRRERWGRSPNEHATAIAAGLLLSLLVALRAASFTPEGGHSLAAQPSGLVLLWAAASALVVPVGLWIRSASLKAHGSVDRAFLLGTALSSLPLALFGGVLKSATHHRPLGGATFAVVACVVLTLSVALALRVGRSMKPWLGRFFLIACSGSAAAALLLAALASRPALLDFVTLAAACAGAGLLKIPTQVAGLPRALTGVLWVALLSCGLLLTGRAELMTEARSRAPVSFAAFSWLGGGS